MCGVIGVEVWNVKKLKTELRWVFNNQRSRGVQGFGVGLRSGASGKMYRERTTTEKGIFNSDIWGMVEEGDHLIFHHRIPTTTYNAIKCNHPISNEGGDLLLVHNGHVAMKHAEKLQLSHAFETLTEVEMIDVRGQTVEVVEEYTDSEVAVHLFEEVMLSSGSVKTSLNMLGEMGCGVFLMLKSDTKGVLISGGGLFGTPLTHFWGSSGNCYVASVAPVGASCVFDVCGVSGILVDGAVEVLDRAGAGKYQEALQEPRKVVTPVWKGGYTSFKSCPTCGSYVAEDKLKTKLVVKKDDDWEGWQQSQYGRFGW